MLVFIGLILVYGLLFAILAVSKAILDKDKKPPTSSKSSHTQSSSKKPAYPVKTVPKQRRSTVDEDAWILLQSRKSLLQSRQGVLPSLQSHVRSFMTQTASARIARSERMIESGAGI
ncbi:MAG: hypothetical protein ACLS6W_00135 [Ruminococcus sp.]